MRTISELMSLQGRRALITGAAGNLGGVIASTLAELGSDLILSDLPNSNMKELENNILKKSDIDIKIINCNLEYPKSRKQLISNILDDKKGLDILINAAAFVSTNSLKGWTTDFENQSLETWNRAIEVNLTAIFDLSKSLSSQLKQGKKGTIINIGSIYGSLAPDYSLYEGTNMGNPAAYAASKGGLIQLTRWLATSLANEIRVNSISPGGIFRNQPDAFVKRYAAKTPLKRMATEEDFKGIVAYLASDLSEYVTGQNIMVDGGWSIW